MKCLILCAGYENSSFSLEKHVPRCLLMIQKNQTILDIILEKVSQLKEITEVIIVTNNHYYNALATWKENRKNDVCLINDTTNNKNECLGAVGDILYTINDKDIKDDLLVISGDNVFDFSLDSMVHFFTRYRNTVVGAQKEDDMSLLSYYGVIEVDNQNKIKTFEEKPTEPKGNIKSLGIYLFPKEILSYIKFYLEEGNRVDTPGYFIEYLLKKENVYMYEFDGTWFDIHEENELLKARTIWKEKN